MRRNTKFSSLKLRVLSFFFLKQRILHFKRPKWRFIQKVLKSFIYLLRSRKIFRSRLKIRTHRGFLLYKPFAATFFQRFKGHRKLYSFFFKKETKLRLRFFQPVFLVRHYSRWLRTKILFRMGLHMKRCFLFFYDFRFKLSNFVSEFKKQKLRKYTFSLFFIKPEFRIDIVLWRLNFFLSVYAARHAIRSRKILCNFLYITKIFFINFGDIIQLNFVLCKYSFFKAIKRLLIYSLVPGHFEVDFYAGLIVCIQAYSQYSLSDVITVKRNAFTLSRLKNYLIKKY